MRRTKIKASAVTNLTDARYFAAREVEWLGFRFGGGPDTAISPLAAKAIAEWVDGVKVVGEFDLPTAADIAAARQLMHLDAVQVGMFTPEHELGQMPELTYIREVVVEKSTTEAGLEAHFRENSNYCAYYLLDFTKVGIGWAELRSGGNLSTAFLKSLFRRYKTILALDFRPGEAREMLDALTPEGLSLSGGSEERVGLKSFDELDEILDELELIG